MYLIKNNLQILGVDPGDESFTSVRNQRSCHEDLEGVSSAGRALSRQRGLKVGGFGEGRRVRRAQRPQSLVFRRGRRPRLPPDAQRLVLAVPALRHVQGRVERVEEEGQVHTQSVWRETLRRP